MYNNDNMRYTGEPNGGKLPNRTFWQRYRWFILATIGILLLLFFASTTLYLLVTRSTTSTTTAIAKSTSVAAVSTSVPTPTPAPTDTPTPSLGATTSASTSVPATSLNTKTTNYQFICLGDCNGKLGVVLNSIVVNPTSQTMAWNFTVTNIGTCSSMSGRLTLEDPQGGKLQPNGGTFTESITVAQGQGLPRSATFSSIPTKGTQYTVTLSMNCGYGSDDYQPVLFTY